MDLNLAPKTTSRFTFLSYKTEEIKILYITSCVNLGQVA